MFLVAGTAILAVWAARNMAVFAVVATPILSRQLDEVVRERKKDGKLAISRTFATADSILNWVLLFIVLLGGVA
ncbi:MAG: hypothetical protein R3C10_28315 [Pirellulales bacterium]